MRSGPHVDPVATADRVARSFAVSDPVGSLADLGITLLVRAEWLWLPGKRVRGVWDPCLRRIELHGCRADDADRDLVCALGHELGHALLGAQGPRRTREEEESAAAAFARAWLEALGGEGIGACGRALRELADGAEYSGNFRAGGFADQRGGILPIG